VRRTQMDYFWEAMYSKQIGLCLRPKCHSPLTDGKGLSLPKWFSLFSSNLSIFDASPIAIALRLMKVWVDSSPKECDK
jgi:hypothetical protein